MILTRAAPLVALFASVPAWADCPTPSSNSDLLVALEEAGVAFGDLDVEAFQEKREAAVAHLDCLNEPISRNTAAEFHRIGGIAQFLDRDSPSAKKSFAAARAIEPAYTFPTDIVPEGNPLLEAYTALDPKAGQTEVVARPRVGAIKLDGSGSLNRARDLPTIYQLFDGKGAVIDTALVAGGDDLPSYDTAAGGGAPVDKPPRDKAKRSGPNLPLLIAGGGAVVAAGGLYGGAMATRSSYNAETADLATLDSRRATTNTLTIASGVAGVAGLGLGATSFLLSGRF